MTTKKIAEAVGKDESVVRRWVRRLAGKMPVIAGKMTASSPMHPADYDEEETIAIIKEGMGDSTAGVYRANAENRQPGTEIRVKRLPAATQMKELASIYGRDEASFSFR